MARIPLYRIARCTDASVPGVKLAIKNLIRDGVIVCTSGGKTYAQGKVISRPNEYSYSVGAPTETSKTIECLWDYKDESFNKEYLRLIKLYVKEEDYKLYFTKKELEEIKSGLSPEGLPPEALSPKGPTAEGDFAGAA